MRLPLKSMLMLPLAVALVGCLADADELKFQSKSPSGECPLFYPRADLCASITWDVAPTNEIDGELTLRFWSASEGTPSGPYVQPSQTPFVKLWMPDMGHGSSPVKLALEGDAYKAVDVHFVMGGNWEVWVQLKNASTVVEQAKIDVSL